MGNSYNLEVPIARQRDVEAKEHDLSLTGLELQIVAAVVTGHTSKESAEMLGISQRSLRHHIANIMAKLGVVKNRLELVLVALQNMINPSE